MTGSSRYGAYPGDGDVVVCPESVRADPCDNFLYGFKGAPRRAGPDGLDVEHEKRARIIAREMNARVRRRERPGSGPGDAP
jgi:hypothetical protein